MLGNDEEEDDYEDDDYKDQESPEASQRQTSEPQLKYSMPQNDMQAERQERDMHSDSMMKNAPPELPPPIDADQL